MSSASQPPQEPPGIQADREYLLYCDGASRGNPGQASVGFVILDPEGNEIVWHGEVLGAQTTNNVAEYEAALRGIRTALELGIRRLRTRMDSQLVVRQVTGAYKVRHAGLQPLHAALLQLVRGFESFDIEHIPRANNARADALANAALDDLVSQ